VTPIKTANNRPGKAISTGEYSYPLAITVVPTSHLAEVVDTYSGQVSTINLKTGRARKPILIGDTAFPLSIAVVR
jgi:DNA-binding beta-propeller fold protein YncE